MATAKKTASKKVEEVVEKVEAITGEAAVQADLAAAEVKDAVKKASRSAARSKTVKKAKAAVETAALEAELAKAEAKDKAEEVKKAAKKKVSSSKAVQKVKAAAETAELQAELAKAEVKAKAEPKKAAAKKAPAPKKAKVAASMILQFNENDYTQERLIQSAKDVWQYDMGRDVAEIETIKLYVKPEESKVYAVINDAENLQFFI